MHEAIRRGIHVTARRDVDAAVSRRVLGGRRDKRPHDPVVAEHRPAPPPSGCGCHAFPASRRVICARGCPNDTLREYTFPSASACAGGSGATREHERACDERGAEHEHQVPADSQHPLILNRETRQKRGCDQAGDNAPHRGRWRTGAILLEASRASGMTTRVHLQAARNVKFRLAAARAAMRTLHPVLSRTAARQSEIRVGVCGHQVPRQTARITTE